MARKPEDVFLSDTLFLLKTCRWRTIHIRPARCINGQWETPVQGDGKGFLDVLALKGPRLLVAELKMAGKKPTPEQEDWLAAWRLVPAAEVYLWYPNDWPEMKKVIGGGTVE